MCSTISTDNQGFRMAMLWKWKLLPIVCLIAQVKVHTCNILPPGQTSHRSTSSPPPIGNGASTSQTHASAGQILSKPFNTDHLPEYTDLDLKLPPFGVEDSLRGPSSCDILRPPVCEKPSTMKMKGQPIDKENQASKKRRHYVTKSPFENADDLEVYGPMAIVKDAPRELRGPLGIQDFETE